MKLAARKLSSAVQEEKRKQAIRLYKTGKSYKEIADLVEVHFETIGEWVDHNTPSISYFPSLTTFHARR